MWSPRCLFRSTLSIVNIDFAARLKSLRHAAELTQEELATRAGLHTSSITQMERGVFVPKMATSERLAQALGMTISNLWNEK
jgi:transcriptional regulator with XRE-family HTH domain